MYVITEKTTDGTVGPTGRAMYEMVERYHLDMCPYAGMTIFEIYSYIKALPYRPDPEEAETLMRPLFTMNGLGTGGDCDDKAIALASWCRLQGIPYRFITLRKKDKPVYHHVACVIHLAPYGWIFADPTYSFNVLGQAREVYAESQVL